MSLTLSKSLSSVLLLYGFITGCAPALSPVSPPENYGGPIAEGPTLQAGDYWVYELGDGRKVKLGAGRLPANLGFPLWIGKTWSYRGEGLRDRELPTSDFRVSTRIDCQVVAFKQLAVAAGTFGAFECECQCTVMSGGYEPWCGGWTIWYAPEVQNIIKIKTESTASSLELLEYKTKASRSRGG